MKVLESPGRTLLNNKENSISSRYARAIAYFRVPLYKKSIKEINSLLKDYPNDPFFIELKAQIISENGKIKEAIKYYRESLKIIPNSTLIMLPLCNLLLEDSKYLKDIKEANNYLNFIVKKEPENIFAWHLKGISHNRLGEPIYANLSAAEEFLRRRTLKMLNFCRKSDICY